ncbi:MAG TPA: sigma-54-dependent Fis family transcriptional regulator [Aquabacterium sp.]|nr:sigma-54-dependent Fis family transcriptional regulator [Aquabacterium sp.]
MRGPFHPASGVLGNHGIGVRRGDEQVRPIAAGLKLGPDHIDKIDQSHERCVALGVSRIERPDHNPLGRSDLAVVRDRNLRLHDHAAPVMEMLYEQIVNTESMVVLCDATGTIIHSIGDDDFLARASKVALQPGVNWSESTKGTNAIGTALIEEVPTLVHADEHYMHANHFLTCSAAPILDPRGNILGVLDVTGDHRSFHQHTMALVKMSARMIENHWLTDDYRNVMRLHFHSRVEFIGTLMEGILAVAADGKLVGANRGALEQLGLSGAALRMHSLTTLFGTTVGALVDRFRSPLATPMPVQLNGGRQFHIHARFNWPVWASLSDAVNSQAGPASGASAATEPSVPQVQTIPPAAPGDGAPRGSGPNSGGLAQLRTGDAQVASVIDKLRRVLDRDIPVLILGETGTGKELLARAIHVDSARAKQPFVAVNCASIPETLIEAELFGYEDGAFTGARRKGAVGKIVQANGGTLFLDEIGDMPVALQAHLLRVLQERQVTPLGSTKSVAVDVSIICATHRNLREMIDQKAFREDLFYRLNGLAVRLPPLRERSDLLALVRRILDQLTENGGGGGGSRQRHLQPDAEVLRLFQHYSWPGNVRQLFNVLRTAAVMAASEPVITREHLSDDFLDEACAAQSAQQAAAEPAPVVPAAAAPVVAAQPAAAQPMQPAPGTAAPPTPRWSGETASAPRSLEEMEIDAIRRAVDEAGGNISEASKRLGISRNTIYRKLRWNAPK